MVIHNWRDTPPKVGHESAIIWDMLSAESAEGAPYACLRSMLGIHRHMLQGRQSSDYHNHPNLEQIYYILQGTGTMRIDGENYKVRDGDVVYLPPGSFHQMINDGDDWLGYLIISGSRIS